MTEVKEDPELIALQPIEASMSGRNSVYHFCDERQQQVGYAVCLHTIKKIEDGTIPRDQFVECQRAYTHNNCPAKKMREQERLAGHALFFVERVFTAPATKKPSDGAVSSGRYDMRDPGYARGWAIGGRDGYTADEPKRSKPTRNIGPIVKAPEYKVKETMADLVNVMMVEEKAKAAKPAVSEPVVNPTRPMPGESTADFIKRRAAEGKKK